MGSRHNAAPGSAERTLQRRRARMTRMAGRGKTLRTAGIVRLAFSAVLLLAMLSVASCSRRDDPPAARQLIILGFDGMDPVLAGQMMAEGKLPNFAALAKDGGFKPLGTSTPPQSPVAWSSIITGTNPGVHGIFDFIHRNPQTYRLAESTTRTDEGGWPIPLGRWRIPLKGGRVVNLRHGKPFWEYLTEAGLNAHVYRIPANYPPQKSPGDGEFLTLTDMGTPDLTGSLGEFSFYDSGAQYKTTAVGGGRIDRITVIGNVAKGAFRGPPDGLLDAQKNPEAARKPLEVPFTITRDEVTSAAVIEWEQGRLLLNEGEWSDWQPVEFSMGPGVGGARVQTISGRMRLYLKQVRPRLQLYVSPIQIDPAHPALPVGVPADFSAQVAAAIGSYYTQGLPENTKGLTAKILNRREFLDQARLVHEERVRLLDFALGRFQSGLLFFYFGGTDLVAHMFWGTMLADHPAVTAEEREQFGQVVRDLYVEVDGLVGQVRARFPQATLICLSDHGFGNFARGLNVNRWLIDNGYAALKSRSTGETVNSFDWGRTRAYAIGLNGLYLNLRGREGQGIVEPAERSALLAELRTRLLELRDPENGRPVLKEVYLADQVYSGDQTAFGPDLLLGYDRDYRVSWTTALGGAPADLLESNTDAWCGDHCQATDLVPGVVFCNRPITLEKPDLEDVLPTILAEFGLPQPASLQGASLLDRKGK